jgi:hypothetical protein
VALLNAAFDTVPRAHDLDVAVMGVARATHDCNCGGWLYFVV